eukprot:IDg15290t1
MDLVLGSCHGTWSQSKSACLYLVGHQRRLSVTDGGTVGSCTVSTSAEIRLVYEYDKTRHRNITLGAYRSYCAVSTTVLAN